MHDHWDSFNFRTNGVCLASRHFVAEIYVNLRRQISAQKSFGTKIDTSLMSMLTNFWLERLKPDIDIVIEERV